MADIKTFNIQGYLSAFTSGAAIKFLALALGLLLEIIIARSLGADAYGVYSFGIAVLGIALLFLNRGANNNIIRFAPTMIVSNRSGLKEFIQWTRKRINVGILFVIPVALLLIPFLEKTNNAMDRQVYITLLIAACFVCYTQIHQSFFHAQRNAVCAQLYEDILRPLTILILLGLNLLILSGKTTVYQLAFFYIIGAAVAFALSFLRIRPYVYLFSDDQNPAIEGWKKSANEFFYINIMDFILRRLDVIIVTFIVTAAEAGNYKVAVRISELVALPLWISNLYVGPMITQLFHDKRAQELQTLLSLSTRFAFAVTLAGCTLLLFIGESILGWFGKDFIQAFSIVLILVVGSLMNVACGPVHLLLTMTGHAALVLRVQSIAGLVTVAGLVGLTWLYGISGSAIAIVLGNAIWNLWLCLIIRKKLALNTTLLPNFRSS